MEDKLLENIKKTENLNELESIFLDIYKDFTNYKISLDDFSYYCGQLNRRYIDLKIHDQGDFETATDYALELDWYLRQPKPHDFILSALREIHNYAKKVADERGIKLEEASEKSK